MVRNNVIILGILIIVLILRNVLDHIYNIPGMVLFIVPFIVLLFLYFSYRSIIIEKKIFVTLFIYQLILMASEIKAGFLYPERSIFQYASFYTEGVVILTFYTIGRLYNEKMFFPLICASIVVVIISMQQIIMGNTIISHDQISYEYNLESVIGYFGHPNLLGYFLVLCAVPPIYILLIEKRDRTTKYILYIYLIIVLFLILKTYSRGAVISFMFFNIIIFIYNKNFKDKIVFLALFLIVSAYIYNSHNHFFLRFTASELGQGTMISRLKIWELGYSLFQGNPLLGIGPGMFNGYYSYYAMHNGYILILAESGILTFILYIILWYLLISKKTTKIKESVNTAEKQKYIISFSTILTYMLALWADNIITAPAINWYFWVFAGIIYTNKYSRVKSRINSIN